MSTTYGTHLRRWALSLPFIEYFIIHLRDLLIRSLKCGPIPQHVAFVMDGNRRYARSRKIETVEGHNLGFEALARILEVCYKSGVKVVTIYAFSIENFKRSKWEVDALMDMAKTKLVQMAQHGEIFDRYGAKLRILGDRSLLREDVLKRVDHAVQMTAHNEKAVLNVCFPYTGREEITHAIRETVNDFSSMPERRPSTKKVFSETRIRRNIQNQHLSAVSEELGDDGSTIMSSTSDAESFDAAEHDTDTPAQQSSSSRTSDSSPPAFKPTQMTLPDPEAITETTLTESTYTFSAPPLDLLVRTSGVQRLSDFMLWQCHQDTELRFLDCLWPEFDLWQFLPVLLEWQYNQKRKQAQATPASKAVYGKALKSQ